MFDKLLFLGDVYLDQTYNVELPIGHSIIFNLEAPITTHNKPIPGKINLKCKGESLSGTFDPLPLAVCLSNNHIMDYGNKGFEDTLLWLKNNGIGFFGAGNLENNFANPLTIEINKERVGVCGYCQTKYFEQVKHVKDLKYAPAPADLNRIATDINKLKTSGVDTIIVQFHWGTIESSLPNFEQIIIGEAVLRMGADLIIGHHSHTVQPVCEFSNGAIAYGLGNFIFPDIELPAYYNKSGKPMDIYREQQRAWNKCSIGYSFDVKSKLAKIYYFYFDSGRVTISKRYYHRFSHQEICFLQNKINSKIKKDIGKKRLMNSLISFKEAPRMPRITGIIGLLKHIKDIIKCTK